MDALQVLTRFLHYNPWAMTSAIINNPSLNITASVSAQEITQWTDDIGITVSEYILKDQKNTEHRFNNYSVNIERTLFDIEEKVDCVIA